jgi:hypothetical protein
MLASGAADFMDALADIQNEVDGAFRVPELDHLTPDNRKAALIAAALARGQQVREAWSEETLPVPPDFTHVDGDPLPYTAELAFHIGDQTVHFGTVAVQLNSAASRPADDPNSATHVTVTPAGDNIKISKWVR